MRSWAPRFSLILNFIIGGNSRILTYAVTVNNNNDPMANGGLVATRGHLGVNGNEVVSMANEYLNKNPVSPACAS